MKIGKSSHSPCGFTLVELLVIIAVVLVIVLLAVPVNRKDKAKADRIKCVNNLKNVGLSFRIFATDNGDRYPMSLSTKQGGSLDYADSPEAFRHFQAMSNELSTPRILICPNDDREAASRWESLRNENISYFVGLQATQTAPHLLLAGDRNLTTNGIRVRSGIIELSTNAVVGWSRELHDGQGNIVLGDGSVQQVNARRLQDQVATSGLATTRLAVP